ncbi:dynamin family protein [Defluviimonas sp. WL0002]|uniref:Dynamin family protein n=1 Tax=Albidovulum marisflavi TaxID=2984159 RepID=A0ABT2ZHJ5_9RHOB|nr:dynamin family protein [Defluviimonas sp. WL0002]MCV2870608.1 dynamin family protein [Defluviimonas sp. WL0002]
MVRNRELLSSGNAAFAGLASSFSELSETLDRLASVADDRTAARAAGLKARLEEFSAKITFVGQVKAGKSALTNILAATPGLLPSDVNPWTSVVTTVAINTKAPADVEGPTNTKARFTFFSRDEWDNLVVGGGRLGELAERSGAQEELADIQRQVQAMRDATKARLGRHFELLLGQNHSYGYVDPELVERYVCLGDDVTPGEGNPQTGRFADITKSAELFLDIPEYDVSLTLCDTPGVNDTFMMREQITLRSLRGSELCVVVLSAHQALSTVDMALMRIISNLENRQIILFVNRVDELQDPAGQIDEIRSGILATLKKFNIASDVGIVFGSAKWGEAALMGSYDGLSADSRKALEQFGAMHPELAGRDEWETAWNLSGLPGLLNAVAERVSEGAGKRLLERVRRNARNLTNEARATLMARRSGGAAVTVDFAGHSASSVMQQLAAKYESDVAEVCQQLRDDLMQRMQSAESGFVKRATDSLLEHLERHGESGTWQYDPTGLRVLQRAAYLSFARAMSAKLSKLYEDAARHVEAIYSAVLSEAEGEFRIEAPHAPRVPAPVGLGKTIALDLQSTWWRRWWQKRRGYEAFAKDYAHLIRAEANSITRDLEENQVASVLENARAILREFLKEHQETIRRITQPDADTAEDARKALGVLQAGTDTGAAFGEILRGLDDMAA